MVPLLPLILGNGLHHIILTRGICLFFEVDWFNVYGIIWCHQTGKYRGWLHSVKLTIGVQIDRLSFMACEQDVTAVPPWVPTQTCQAQWHPHGVTEAIRGLTPISSVIAWQFLSQCLSSVMRAIHSPTPWTLFFPLFPTHPHGPPWYLHRGQWSRRAGPEGRGGHRYLALGPVKRTVEKGLGSFTGCTTVVLSCSICSF